MTLVDKAVQVCPVGVILPKRKGFDVPIGERLYDAKPISGHVHAPVTVAEEE